MRSTPLYAPDGMTSAGLQAERFDDGLVHNHHWAVSADESYGGQFRGSAHQRRVLTDADTAAIRRRAAVPHDHDRHDDGLVHNHHWAVSGK